MKGIKDIIKSLLKSQLAIALYIMLFIAFLFYLFGFRITYSPELDNNWNAISAIGQWVGALIGLFIPIAVVYIEKTINENRKQIGESNVELFKEFEDFKKEYGEKIIQLTSLIDKDGNIVIDGGTFDQVSKGEQDIEELKLKALKFINISMSARTSRIAEYLNVEVDRAYDILYEMVMHDRSITSAGILTKENPDNGVWMKKK